MLKASTKKVALFANDDADYIAKVLNKTNFTHIQFHGNEIDELHKYNLPLHKGISYTNNGFNNLDKKFPDASAFIDSHGEDGLGGTGKTFD